MNELVDRLIADLKSRYERSGLTYGEVVMLDDIISAFENARTQAAADHEIGLLGTRILPSTCYDAVRRWKSS